MHFMFIKGKGNFYLTSVVPSVLQTRLLSMEADGAPSTSPASASAPFYGYSKLWLHGSEERSLSNPLETLLKPFGNPFKTSKIMYYYGSRKTKNFCWQKNMLRELDYKICINCSRRQKKKRIYSNYLTLISC